MPGGAAAAAAIRPAESPDRAFLDHDCMTSPCERSFGFNAWPNDWSFAPMSKMSVTCKTVFGIVAEPDDRRANHGEPSGCSTMVGVIDESGRLGLTSLRPPAWLLKPLMMSLSSTSVPCAITCDP